MGMVVMVLERVPESLRGELTRWLFEPQTGVFVGTVSALVRDQLWKKCEKRLRGGAMMQLWATNTEQGFAMRTSGALSKEVVDYQGLQLLRTPLPAKKDRPE